MSIHLRDISLKSYNSFGVEAKASDLIEYGSAEELSDILANQVMDRPWCVLSGGNNILFTEDYNGILLHPVSKGIEIVAQTNKSVIVRVDGGQEWDSVVEWAVENGFWGIENLSLIPGYAGAAPVQNIGAYGAELKDVLDSVEVLMADSLRMVRFSADECLLGYRTSIFKNEYKGRAIITAIYIKLNRKPSPNLSYGELESEVHLRGGPYLKEIREAVIYLRRTKLPDPKTMGNAGSFFKNPVILTDRIPRLHQLFPKMPVYPSAQDGYSKISGGWLIEKAGWKGYRYGRVKVHPEQSLVLVNIGGAKGKDILTLARSIQRDLAAKFGIKIEFEVNILPK